MRGGSAFPFHPFHPFFSFDFTALSLGGARAGLVDSISNDCVFRVKICLFVMVKKVLWRMSAEEWKTLEEKAGCRVMRKMPGKEG